MGWLAVFIMLAAPPALAVEGSPPFYAPKDGVAPSWEARDQGYVDGYVDHWRDDREPWLRRQPEASGRGSEPWTDYGRTPYPNQERSDQSRYRGPVNGWVDSPEGPRSAAGWSRPRYYEPYDDGLRHDAPSSPPRFQDRSDEYNYERSQVPADPWADGWRDGGSLPRPHWHSGENWRSNGYREPPVTGHGRDFSATEGGGRYRERQRDPWDASYTPAWGGDGSSSYYDPEPSEAWVDPEVEANHWGWEAEERPWGRRRSPPAESARSARDEPRQGSKNVPPEPAYRYGAGVGPYYGAGGYYPDPYGLYSPPLGMPGPGTLSGLAAWERLLWAAGWPAMMW